MSPERSATAFRPAPLAGAGRVDEHQRAAGYAAGWAAGARAAAEAAEVEQRRRAEQAREVEERRDAALAHAVATLQDAAEAMGVRTAPVLAEVERAVHLAALELAEAVLQHEISGPGSARNLLDRALALPLQTGPRTLRLHPADLARLEDELAARDIALPTAVALVADASLVPGDVVCEDASGLLDARIRAALDRARRALLEADA